MHSDEIGHMHSEKSYAFRCDWAHLESESVLTLGLLTLTDSDFFQELLHAPHGSVLSCLLHLNHLNNEGLALYASGNYTGAVKTYDKVLSITPNYVVALNNKGVSLSGLENYTGAIKYYDKALAINPNYVEGLNNKGLALYGLGNYTGAIKYYDKALAINPNYVNSLNNKGNALVRLGRYEEADINYNQAKLVTGSKKGGFITQSYNESEQYIRMFRVDDVITNQDSSNKVIITNQDASNEVIITNQGILDKLRKNYDLAIVRFNFVLTHIDPNYYYALWNEADAYRLSGQNVEAKIYYKEAIAINPTSSYNGELISSPAIDRDQGCNGLFKTLAAICG